MLTISLELKNQGISLQRFSGNITLESVLTDLFQASVVKVAGCYIALTTRFPLSKFRFQKYLCASPLGLCTYPQNRNQENSIISDNKWIILGWRAPVGYYL
jgi:hypothetical protein